MESTMEPDQLEMTLASKLEDFLGPATSNFVANLVAYSRNPKDRNQNESVVEKKNICFNWGKGCCRRGSRCPYLHDKHSNHRPQQNEAKKLNRLLIEKIPSDSCNITAIHEHFSRFGIITNIDLMPEQAKARIQFSTHEQANEAYTCPDVIFGNRFVRLVWDESSLRRPESVASKPIQRPDSISNKSVQKPVNLPAMIKSKSDELQSKKQATLKAMLELQQQKQEILEKRIREQKLLLDKLEHANDEEKTLIMKELSLADSIIQSLSETKPVTQSEHKVVLKGGPNQKPILKGPIRPAPQPTGRPSFSAYSLDLRPKTLQMTPIPAKVGSDPLNLRKLFEPFGQITNLTVDEPASSVTVSFEKRSDAEKALAQLKRSDLEQGLVIDWN